MSISAASSAKDESSPARSRLAVACRKALIGRGSVESYMASPRLLSVMQIYRRPPEDTSRPIWIASIPIGNGSLVLGQQFSEEIDKHGDLAGLAARCRAHGADRQFSRLMVAQNAPHGPRAYVGSEKPVGRLRDPKAGKYSRA